MKNCRQLECRVKLSLRVDEGHGERVVELHAGQTLPAQPDLRDGSRESGRRAAGVIRELAQSLDFHGARLLKALVHNNLSAAYHFHEDIVILYVLCQVCGSFR